MVNCDNCGVRITLMGRGFSAVAHLDAELPLHCGEHLFPAAHVTGGTETDSDGVLSPRYGREVAVEGHDSCHLTKGDAEAPCDVS